MSKNGFLEKGCKGKKNSRNFQIIMENSFGFNISSF